MSKQPKTKTRAANLAVPSTRDEAADFIRQIGEDNRRVARLQADMNDELAVIKARFEAEAAPLNDLVRNRVEGLKIWCEVNRDRLTQGGKVKFADLGTGKVIWRTAPPKVTIKGVEAVIAAIQKLGLAKLFLRTKIEVNKEAMLAEPARARVIPGVSIGSEGEDFSVEPFEAQIEGAAA